MNLELQNHLNSMCCSSEVLPNGDNLFEEAHELNKDTNLEEMADLLEVLYAIAQAHGYTPMQIEEARLKKLEERGAFKDRILLTSID